MTITSDTQQQFERSMNQLRAMVRGNISLPPATSKAVYEGFQALDRALSEENFAAALAIASVCSSVLEDVEPNAKTAAFRDHVQGFQRAFEVVTKHLRELTTRPSSDYPEVRVVAHMLDVEARVERRTAINALLAANQQKTRQLRLEAEALLEELETL